MKWLFQGIRDLAGAVLFYTVLPLPNHWPADFQRIARWVTWVGLLLGLMLSGLDWLLGLIPNFTWPRQMLIVLVWLRLTGGLHLDGAMDAADGLGVIHTQRRLEVMQDSRSGAFGVMAAIAIMGLKVTALAALDTHRSYGLVSALVWGRWAQLIAIAQYPYLKPAGKGAFHKKHLQLPQDLWPSLLVLIGLGLFSFRDLSLLQSLGGWMGGAVVAWAVGAWFARQFQGMTGDIYGAITEWVEALFLWGISAIY